MEKLQGQIDNSIDVENSYLELNEAKRKLAEIIDKT